MDTHPILEPLNALLHLTPEQDRELRDAGYVPADVYTEVNRLLTKWSRAAAIRLTIDSMTNNQRESLHCMIEAMKQKELPDMNYHLQQSFMHLIGDGNYHDGDLTAANNILKAYFTIASDTTPTP